MKLALLFIALLAGPVRAEAPSAPPRADDTLARLKDAYNQKKLSAFMDLVSRDFPGGKSKLKKAVKSDFDSAGSLVWTLQSGQEAGTDTFTAVSVVFDIAATRLDGTPQNFKIESRFELALERGRFLLLSVEPEVFGRVLAAAPPPPEVIGAGINQTVADLLDAYNSKRRSAFMKLVSDNFIGDASALEDQISQDFKIYDSASLALRPGAPSINGAEANVPFQYSLKVVTRLGNSRVFSGQSSFGLAWEDGKMRVKRISGQIFGQVADEDLEASARDTLSKLAEAYSNKARSAFMRLVADDFLGNTEVFEDALVQDFRNYGSVNLQMITDQANVSKDLITVDFHYNLAVVNAEGVNQTFSGRSEYLFKWEGGVAMLYKMDLPLIFGNSLPASENPTASNTGASPVNSSPGSAPGVVNAPPASSVVLGSALLNDPPNASFKFKTQTVTGCFNGVHDFCVGNQLPRIVADNKVLDIGSCNLSTLATIPTATQPTATIVVGHCYAFLTTEGLYAAIQVTSFSTPGASTITGFNYAFQPNGTNKLQ